MCSQLKHGFTVLSKPNGKFFFIFTMRKEKKTRNDPHAKVSNCARGICKCNPKLCGALSQKNVFHLHNANRTALLEIHHNSNEMVQ